MIKDIRKTEIRKAKKNGGNDHGRIFDKQSHRSPG